MPDTQGPARDAHWERLRKRFYCLVCGRAADISQVRLRSDVCQHARWIEEEPPSDEVPPTR